jgi:hypothetical protein
MLWSGGCKRTQAENAWLVDLDFLATTLRMHHPKLACGAPREQFDRDVFALKRRIPALDRAGAIVALETLIASLHDGHTQIPLTSDPAVGFHRFPLRLYFFADGLYVQATDEAHRSLLGARVKAIEGHAIDDIINRVRPLIHGDNESAALDILPSRLVLAEVLHVVGVTQATVSAAWQFGRDGGSVSDVVLTALPPGTEPQWLIARAPSARTPEYLEHADRPYWSRSLDNGRVLYIQINALENNSDDPLSTFCRRVFTSAEAARATRLVLDLRLNNGGDNELNRAVVHEVIRSDRFNQKGRLFVVIGRLTFSAAVNLAADLERETNVIFVGEPTEAPGNHYGETAVARLPRSGITLLYSTLYWQSAGPRDQRPWIAPQIPTPLRFDDFWTGRDPALAAILAYTQ